MMLFDMDIFKLNQIKIHFLQRLDEILCFLSTKHVNHNVEI